MTDKWCTIESDPGVFSELIAEMGVKQIAVEEIWDMSAVVPQGESYGLIFLFKWRKETDSRPMATDANSEDIFFAQQVIQNACGTQAILSVLLNAESIDRGPVLGELKAFTSQLDPESRGMVIGSSDAIRAAHNSFARPEPFLQDEDDDSKDSKNKQSEDVYHFIAYVPFRGSVYELDGLKAGPIKLGDVTAGSSWWDVARPAIEERIARYSAEEVSFALLSVCEERRAILERGIAAASADSSSSSRLQELQAELADELVRLQKQKEENQRRRHNFTPFIISLIRALAVKGDALDKLVDAARARRIGGN